MATYTIPQQDVGLGIPARTTDTINAILTPILLGDDPDVVSQSFEVAASQTLAALTVVGLDANGRIVAATWNATPASRIDPIGVLCEAITTDSSTNYKGALVWVSGHFNYDRLVWDGTFSTDAQKYTVLQKRIGVIKATKIKSGTPA